MKFKFKVTSFRSLYESENGRKICVFAAPISSIPAEWEDWRDVNVRDTNVKGDVYNAIIDTLKNAPEEMIFRNLGITLLAPEIEYDNKSGQVTIEFTDKDKHGIANGGHTFSAIREVLRTDNVEASIKVECIIGKLSPDELVDIVDGRNIKVIKESELSMLKQRRRINVTIRPGDKNLSYMERLKKTGWMSAEQRRTLLIDDKIKHLENVLRVADMFDAINLHENFKSLMGVREEIERLKAEKEKIKLAGK